MSQYIEYIADVLLQNLGYNKYYNSSNPFDFMDNFNLQIKSNFFETRTTTYKKVSNDRDKKIKEDINEDF
jgi:ribonucleotide reductase beta subunit family protein with ferritin-like domain